MRAAMALLHAAGVTVRLRLPAPAAAGDDSEQLGLATPAFQDVAVGRGVFRKANSTELLLLPASAVETACAAQTAASAEALFASAAGLLIGDGLYGIAAWAAMRAGDTVYGYTLTLAAPAQ